MNAYGIKFVNRTKTVGVDAEDPAFKNAEFFAFAALCEMSGLNQYVNSVEYCSNSGCYWIDVDDKYRFTDIEGGIDWSADKTLSQYILFGTCWHKHGLSNHGGW